MVPFNTGGTDDDTADDNEEDEEEQEQEEEQGEEGAMRRSRTPADGSKASRRLSAPAAPCCMAEGITGALAQCVLKRVRRECVSA
jgi:hypothetical protein